MAKKSDTERFVETALSTSGKLQSVVLLLDRAIVLLKAARNDSGLYPENIVKAQNIIVQLQMALNFREGDLAGRIFFLLDFFFEELNRRDDRAMDACIRLMTDLRDSINRARGGRKHDPRHPGQ